MWMNLFKTERTFYVTICDTLVVDMTEGCILVVIHEKPKMAYQINMGGIFLPRNVEEIPNGEFFHITYLMAKVHRNGGRIERFPINYGS